MGANRHNPFVTIDATGFDEMLGALSRLTGKDFDEVIDHEAARIIEGAIKRTNPNLKDSKQRVRARYTYKDDASDSKKRVTYANVNGKRRLVRKIHKKGFYVLRGRGKNRKKVWDPDARNPLWRPLQAELKRLREWKMKRIGMSKATWLYIAKRAKLRKVKHPAWVKKALGLMTSNLRLHLNGRKDGKFNRVITIKNFGKVAMIRGGRRKGADGFAAFRQAFKGRIGYFKENSSQGVFKKAQRIAKKYPGLDVTPVANTQTSDRV